MSKVFSFICENDTDGHLLYNGSLGCSSQEDVRLTLSHPQFPSCDRGQAIDIYVKILGPCLRWSGFKD